MIHALLHNMPTLAKRASFPPLLELLECKVYPYNCVWENVQARSWTLGQKLRDWGQLHYGSTWNWFVPYYHEWALSRRAGAGSGDVVHFLMGEMGSPRHPRWFTGKGARLVGTFHCSARRMVTVLKSYCCLFAFDHISLMSRSQLPFFLERGYPEDRIHITRHGVDTEYFRPSPTRNEKDEGAPLRLMLVGSTERDHEFAAQVMRRIEKEPLQLDVLTAPNNHHYYQGLANVRLLNTVTDEQLLEGYQDADLLFMPVDDCTANNTVLEAMACGTPVMVNRIGGMPEYVDAECNFMMDGKDAKAWAECLTAMVHDRENLSSRRSAVRTWAESLDWKNILPEYLALYDAALSGKPIREVKPTGK